MNKKVILMFVFLLSFGLLLAACGGGGGETQQPTAPPEDNNQEEATNGAEQEETNEDTSYLQEDGVFTFAMSGEYHPFNYVNETTGELTGFDVEIGQAIAAYHGWEANPVATPWSGILSGLRSGNFDAIIGSMGINDDRKDVVDFSDPYYYSGAQLFAKKGSATSSIDDITETTVIGIALGTSYEPVAEEYTNEIRPYESDVTALRDLASSDNLEAVITDRLVGLIAIEETGFELEMAGGLIFEEQMGIPVQKENQELLDKINEALAAIREDGTYLEISQRYFGIDIGTTN